MTRFDPALLLEINNLVLEVSEAFLDLGDDQLKWSPPDGGWSVGQCLEHLIVSGELYHKRINDVLKRPRLKPSPKEHRSTWMGHLLIRFVSPDIKMRMSAPKVIVPPVVPRKDVVGSFLSNIQETTKLFGEVHRRELARVRTTSPVNGLVKLNLGDCFIVLVVHAQRHVNQAKRVVAHADFPRR